MKALALLVLALAACRTTASVSPYAPPTAGDRETTHAEKLSREAADLVGTNPEKAEAMLREALTLDLFFGPAHNNLGVIFLGQHKLYEAAHEFEWARKLMPGQADPRVNLALTLEQAGRIGEAMDNYRAALEVAPEDIGAIQGIASLAVRSSLKEPALDRWLDVIALRGESEDWRTWARARASARGRE
jgi:Tfp pilus assembly protein PilF